MYSQVPVLRGTVTAMKGQRSCSLDGCPTGVTSQLQGGPESRGDSGQPPRSDPLPCNPASGLRSRGADHLSLPAGCKCLGQWLQPGFRGKLGPLGCPEETLHLPPEVTGALLSTNILPRVPPGRAGISSHFLLSGEKGGPICHLHREDLGPGLKLPRGPCAAADISASPQPASGVFPAHVTPQTFSNLFFSNPSSKS